jgi:hypothetical protein
VAELPPPDPNECYEIGPADGFRLPAPTAVFVGGAASPEADRAADRFLDLRPGFLIVLAPG